jgi:hypothetical protein
MKLRDRLAAHLLTAVLLVVASKGYRERYVALVELGYEARDGVRA